MSTQRFTSEFKAEAVRQVIERGYSVAETAERLGVSTHSLYKRVKSVTPDKTEKQDSELLEAKNEILRLRAQMRRLEEERDILKKSSAVLRQGTRVKYRFMNEHRHQYAITKLCRVLQVARAGFYHWLHKPVSDREKENSRLLGLIRDSYAASRGVYGARRVFADLREAGESCGKHRVAGLMRTYKIKALRGYKAPRAIKGRPSIIAPNRLNRVFTVDTPNKAWVTDITYIRTWQGWLYLAVVLDLYARQVVGWSMKPTLGKELALDALIMAVWRRKPKTRVIVHSDQGAQYGSDDWKRFCLANHL